MASWDWLIIRGRRAGAHGECEGIDCVQMGVQDKEVDNSFDKMVKVRTTPDVIIEGSWGFEHTKKVFKAEVIPFINSLRASFKDFENTLYNELNEVKMTFNQMEAAVKQCYVHKKYFDISKERIPLAPKLLNNKDAHIDYIKHSREHVDILREIVKHARALRHLDSYLNSACKIVQRISEADSYKTQDSNKPMLPSTRMKCSTSASRSQPSSNTKNNRILQTTCSNVKNKVEDHPRSVKSKSNKMNHVIELAYNAHWPGIEKIVWGFGVRPDTLDPTILNISMPLDRDGLWHVLMYTLNSDTWTVLGNYRFPRLEVEAAVVTSWIVLFVIPSQNIAKLLGFTIDDDPIVEVDSGQEMVHTLQVYDRPSQQFHNVGIEGDCGSFFIRPYKESLILLDV
nr:hypothetical protein [Tanacetum cinerariifolium]